MEKTMTKEDIREIMAEMKKILGTDWKVEAVTVNKIGGKKDGISCKFKDADLASVVYPSDYERLLESGKNTKKVGKYLAEAVKENKGISVDIQKTAEEFQKGLFVQMVNEEANRELLGKAVHESWEDMAAVARCRVQTDNGEDGSFVVTKDNMGLFEMTEGEIMERAYQNTAKQEFTVKSMKDMMAEFFRSEGAADGIPEMLFPEETPMLYVLTNKEKVNGANVLACPEVLHGVYEKFGEPFYVLPSSIHEVLLVKESAGLKPEEMRQIVHDVNITEVKAEDLLSFEIFRHDGKKLSAVKEETQNLTEAVEKVTKKIR